MVFHSAGREDMDVRMLGKGRPLLLQSLNPRKTVSLKNDSAAGLAEFQAFCNGNVEGAAYQEWMKSIENTKRKQYRCLCWLSQPIADQKELEARLAVNEVECPLLLKQWTPIRVLHRRSLTERTKQLFGIELKWMERHWCQVDIISEAGTYIKEFCHGDRGRTTPNLASLLQCDNANIIQLDVVEVLTHK